MDVEASRSSYAGEGWLLFAGIMLITSGVFKIFDGFWAFKYDDDEGVSNRVQTIVFEHDLSSYGWVWLILGIVLIAAGFGVVTRQQWARWTGIIAASIALILYFPWIYFEPIWAMISMLMAFLVIWALAVYGGREQDWM